MEYKTFIDSLTEAEPPETLNDLLQALWFDAQGDWVTAHNAAQRVQTDQGSLVHAYLHRKEGDITNARYWYKMAKADEFNGTIEEEWETLLKKFLE